MNTAVVGPPTPPSLGNMPGGMPLAQPNQFIKVCNTLGHGVGHVKLIEEKGKWFLETQDKKKTLIFTPGPSKNNKVTNPRDLEAVVSYANKAYRNGGVTGKLYPLDLSPQNPFQSAWNALQKGLNEGKKAVEGALQTPVPGTNNLTVGEIVSSVIPIVGPVANATEIAKKAIPAVQNAFSSPTPPLNGATTGSQVIEILKTAKQRAAVSLSQENIKQGKVASYAELKRTLEETEAVYAKHGKTWDASSQENYPLLLNSVKSDLKKMVAKTETVLQTLEAAQQAFTANPSATNLQALKNAQSELTSRQRAEAYAPNQEGRINRALAAAKTASAKNTVPDQLTQALAFYKKNDTAAARSALNEAVHRAEKEVLPQLDREVRQTMPRTNSVLTEATGDDVAYAKAMQDRDALKNEINAAKKLLKTRPHFDPHTITADGAGKKPTYVGVNIPSNRGTINSKHATEAGLVVTELRQERKYLGNGEYENLGWRGVGVWLKDKEGNVLDKNPEKIWVVPKNITKRAKAEAWLRNKMLKEKTAGLVNQTPQEVEYNKLGGLSGALGINFGGTERNLQVVRVKGQDGVKAAKSLLRPVGEHAQMFSRRNLGLYGLSHPNEKKPLPGENLVNEVALSFGLRPNRDETRNGVRVLFGEKERALVEPTVNAIRKAAGTEPPMVSVVPVYVVQAGKEKGSYTSSMTPLFRVKTADGGERFVQGDRIYKDFKDWQANNKLPKGDILVPPNGVISRDVKGFVRLDAFHNNSPSAQVRSFAEPIANVLPIVGMGVSWAGAPQFGIPMVVVGAVASTAFSASNLADQYQHGQSLDFYDVLNVASGGAPLVGGVASSAKAVKLASALYKAGTIADRTALATQLFDLCGQAKKGDLRTVDVAQFLFWVGMDLSSSAAGRKLPGKNDGPYTADLFDAAQANVAPKATPPAQAKKPNIDTNPKPKSTTEPQGIAQPKEKNKVQSRLGTTSINAASPSPEQIVATLSTQYLGTTSSSSLKKTLEAKAEQWVQTELAKPGQTRTEVELLSALRSSPRLVADWLAEPLAQSLLRDAAIGRNAGVGKDALENALARRIAQQYSPELSRKLAMKDSQTSTQLMRAAAVDVFVEQTGAHRPSVEQYLDGQLAGMDTSTHPNYLAGLANPQNKNERQRRLDYLKREFGAPEQNVPPKGKSAPESAPPSKVAPLNPGSSRVVPQPQPIDPQVARRARLNPVEYLAYLYAKPGNKLDVDGVIRQAEVDLNNLPPMLPGGEKTRITLTPKQIADFKGFATHHGQATPIPGAPAWLTRERVRNLDVAPFVVFSDIAKEAKLSATDITKQFEKYAGRQLTGQEKNILQEAVRSTHGLADVKNHSGQNYSSIDANVNSRTLLLDELTQKVKDINQGGFLGNIEITIRTENGQLSIVNASISFDPKTKLFTTEPDGFAPINEESLASLAKGNISTASIRKIIDNLDRSAPLLKQKFDDIATPILKNNEIPDALKKNKILDAQIDSIAETIEKNHRANPGKAPSDSLLNSKGPVHTPDEVMAEKTYRDIINNASPKIKEAFIKLQEKALEAYDNHQKLLNTQGKGKIKSDWYNKDKNGMSLEKQKMLDDVISAIIASDPTSAHIQDNLSLARAAVALVGHYAPNDPGVSQLMRMALEKMNVKMPKTKDSLKEFVRKNGLTSSTANAILLNHKNVYGVEMPRNQFVRGWNFLQTDNTAQNAVKWSVATYLGVQAGKTIFDFAYPIAQLKLNEDQGGTQPGKQGVKDLDPTKNIAKIVDGFIKQVPDQFGGATSFGEFQSLMGMLAAASTAPEEEKFKYKNSSGYATFKEKLSANIQKIAQKAAEDTRLGKSETDAQMFVKNYGADGKLDFDTVENTLTTDSQKAGRFMSDYLLLTVDWTFGLANEAVPLLNQAQMNAIDAFVQNKTFNPEIFGAFAIEPALMSQAMAYLRYRTAYNYVKKEGLSASTSGVLMAHLASYLMKINSGTAGNKGMEDELNYWSRFALEPNGLEGKIVKSMDITGNDFITAVAKQGEANKTMIYSSDFMKETSAFFRNNGAELVNLYARNYPKNLQDVGYSLATQLLAVQTLFSADGKFILRYPTTNNKSFDPRTAAEQTKNVQASLENLNRNFESDISALRNATTYQEASKAWVSAQAHMDQFSSAMTKSGIEIVMYNDWKKEKFADIASEKKGLLDRLNSGNSAQALRETQKATSTAPSTNREDERLSVHVEKLRERLYQDAREFVKLLGDMANDQLTEEVRLQAGKNADRLLNEKIEPTSNELISTYQQKASIYRSPVFNSQRLAVDQEKFAADAQAALDSWRRSYSNAITARSTVRQQEESTATRNLYPAIDQYNQRIKEQYLATLGENMVMRKGTGLTNARTEYTKTENTINGLYVPPRDWTITSAREQAEKVVAELKQLRFIPSAGGNQKPRDAFHDQSGNRVITEQAAVEKLTAYYERFYPPSNGYAPPRSGGENPSPPTTPTNSFSY